MKKVKVDQDVCIGCGFCFSSLDEVFTVDDNDLATTKNDNNILDNMDDNQKENVLDIVEGCPVSAIKIEEIEEK